MKHTQTVGLSERQERGEKNNALYISLFFLLFYVYFQSTSVYGGDGGDLVSAAYVRGVAHPPGYPLYTLIAWILTKIPYSTVAWRVGLLSSIPASATLGFLYLLVTRFTKKPFVALVSTLTLGFSYLFWLYASVPEVFSLHVLLITLILYMFYAYRQSGLKKFFYIGSFLVGLALSHHHTILFLVPGYFLLIQNRLGSEKKRLRMFLKAGLLVLVGLLPYLYVVITAYYQPLINWENPRTLHGLARLITRALYGTFRSGPSFGLNPYDRYLQIRLMTESFVIDFTKLGVFLGLLGAYFQYRLDRKLFFSFLVAFFLVGPFFIFYTGFPTAMNFYLGISERFLLAAYIFFAVWIGYGVAGISEFIDRVLRRFLVSKRVIVPSYILFLILPIALVMANYSKIAPLKNDRTAETLGTDILRTVEPNSLIFMLDDTSIFNTEYVYYTGGHAPGWEGKKVIQLGTLGNAFYNEVLRYSYPELQLTLPDSTQAALTYFVERFYETVPIYSNLKVDVGKDYTWVQMGLLKRLYKVTDSLPTEEYIARNDALFATYQNPVAGALASYTHVTLADVVRVYAQAYAEVGKLLLSTQKYEEAETYLTKSLDLQTDVPEVRLQLAQSLLMQKKCPQALEQLLTQTQQFPNIAETYLFLAAAYMSCDQDSQKAEKYTKIYQEKLAEQKTDLTDF